MSVHKKVDANNIVPKATGSERKENLTILRIWKFAAIIATTVYIYNPISPNIRKKNKIEKKQKNKNNNQVISIGNELNMIIIFLKLITNKINSFNWVNSINYFIAKIRFFNFNAIGGNFALGVSIKYLSSPPFFSTVLNALVATLSLIFPLSLSLTSDTICRFDIYWNIR